MLGEHWTAQDAMVLASMGIDWTDPMLVGHSARSSEFEPERVLQAVADGEVHVYGLDEGWPIEQLWIGTSPVTVDEQEYINDLLACGHLVFIGTRVALTAFGRETLARWSTNQSRGER
ncbi:hypothetical protein SAMN05421805_10156 [Saccharopolyspora antimicrobica]|uniref:Uncharacterized protein n=1 Tax=Saccharopolyspora antimicrobica TaxID=455193 RepID=A0A1I4QBS6_9PSEU|nr:hypothetical protein [Saccharopolyspora antimicrobica]RKT84863.1 hypothetical protein ATL45_3194 [Saccharopolyspora antimicrobica]SFM37497.1 hypothetical protein SAMN05421805_10156 [Saccharopolyspora antimicrobica]